MIVIGSEALRKHGIENGRRRLDIDVVGEYDEIVEFAKQYGAIKSCYPIDDGKKLVVKTEKIIVEGELVWDGDDECSATQLRDLILNDPGTAWEKRPNGWVIPSVNVIYMLKMSHRYLRNSPHLIKTMRDI